jgi:hypothetical protein
MKNLILTHDELLLVEEALEDQIDSLDESIQELAGCGDRFSDECTGYVISKQIAEKLLQRVQELSKAPTWYELYDPATGKSILREEFDPPVSSMADAEKRIATANKKCEKKHALNRLRIISI